MMQASLFYPTRVVVDHTEENWWVAVFDEHGGQVDLFFDGAEVADKFRQRLNLAFVDAVEKDKKEETETCTTPA